MERYEQLAVVGEGSYGLVMKCRHKETDQIVAIKKFVETEDDATVRRMALREIRMLKKLKHENLVAMLEVFRYRKRFYLVFEFVEGTVLDELEKMPGGLGEDRSRERIYQVIRAVNFCHINHIIHRDVKPENVLVSSLGVVKLCDFGFARIIGLNGEPCTEYVATRWYRAPELLVGELNYGPAVDVWAIGCLFAEMMTGDPLFPGESDIDQLYIIVRTIGKPCAKHQQLMSKSSQLRGLVRSANGDATSLYKTFSHWPLLALDFLISCIKMDPSYRPTSDELLKHNYFMHDRFPQRFLPALREKVLTEFDANPLLRKLKADIIISTDKDRKEIRRASHMDQPRWKISLTEGSVKRKFSCDAINNGDSVYSDRNSIRSNQKLTQKNPSKTSVKEKRSSLPRASETEIHMLEKSLESLSRFNQKGEGEPRPLSVGKEKTSPLTLQPTTPPQFQSLQPIVNTSHAVLHPSINNISFGKEPPRKSPNILQSIHSTSLKTTFNQVPLLNPPRSQFLKKLEIASSGNAPWVNGGSRKKENRVKNDDFSLPNVPGASSPDKNRRKGEHDPFGVTPDYRYKRAKRKYANTDLGKHRRAEMRVK